MNNQQIKIGECIESARNNMNAEYDLIKSRSLASAYPKGKTAYFKQKIFELKQEVSESSIIGKDWIINGCDYDILQTNWVYKHISIMLEHLTKYGSEEVIWEQLRLFLKQFFQLLSYEKIVKETEPKRYPEKYYAWYHKILVALGKREQPTPGAKNELVALGHTLYGITGNVFYDVYSEFDLTKRPSFVNSMTPKDRKVWKKIVTEISGFDIDVINFLKNFPN